MPALLTLVPALPLLGFAILFVTAASLPKTAVAAVGVGSTGISAVIALVLAGFFLAGLPSGHVTVVLWRWMAVGNFVPQIALRLDPLSLVMMLVVTFVGFLIHLYSSEFMEGDDGYSRYFAYLNLFVAAMLVLVLARDLLLLFVGWEGVGLCSYLLIGFWYRDRENGQAARKAFIVTRVGDTAMILGLIYLFLQLHTMSIPVLMARAPQVWMTGSAPPIIAASLLLGGALGKSAQLPLQTWLPDAMAGPTPVSALIHAATMVTAGVYLIARMHALFAIAPPVEHAVAGIGAATLLIAAFSALGQHDLKRILAYSTMSQIGYMFLALGVGAWTAAIFHLMTHAFFKALLFLSTGAVMMRLENEHDIFRMGGLRRRLPAAFWSFLVGAAALAALPLVTAGFYSKDMILWGAWSSGPGGRDLWAAGIVGAFLTGVYIFRAVFIVFFGEMKTAPTGRYGWRVVLPLAVLSVLALVAGFLDMPPVFGNFDVFSQLLGAVLPAQKTIGAAGTTQGIAMAIASLAAILGVCVAYLAYLRRVSLLARFGDSSLAHLLHRFFLAGWGFDWIYDRLLVRPFEWLARTNRGDVVDAVVAGFADAARAGHFMLSRSESGRLRWYASVIAAGSLAAIAIAVFA